MPVHYDIIRIGSILKDISRFFSDLEYLKIQEIGDLSDQRNFYAASMILLALLNRVFDLGSEVIMHTIVGFLRPTRKYSLSSNRKESSLIRSPNR